MAGQRRDQRRRLPGPAQRPGTSPGSTSSTAGRFHTARWPADLDLTGQRVAVIGSGCTGYQLIPEIVDDAAHTYVFQRTPSWVFDVPGYLAPVPAAGQLARPQPALPHQLRRGSRRAL